MPRFRSYRGSRRNSIVPRGSTRSVKYQVTQAGASEAAGLQAITIYKGKDEETLGQTGVNDTDVPTGSKVTQVELFMPKVNLGAATANFVTWSIQRTQTGQAVVDPILQAGNPLRRNVMLTGKLGLGAGQNNNLHIKYKIPKKYQRVGDGDVWNIVNNNNLAVSTEYMFIFKVFQ